MSMHGSLHHVEIYVLDLHKSKDFWGWFLGELGYIVMAEWPEGISYKLGETYLVFVQVEERHMDVVYHRKKAGLNHLAFHARSREFVSEITTLLRQRGVPILYEHQHPYAGGGEYYAVFFEDPDRMKVELVAPALEA
jgi:catechol 2,3-dioxygenase-like lactoylglutathione lyase family enzyme